MINKPLVLAASHQHFISFCRLLDLNPHQDAKYVTRWEDMNGWWTTTPVILLEGYEQNQYYTVELMHKVGVRFGNIGFLSEGEMWGYGSNRHQIEKWSTDSH